MINYNFLITTGSIIFAITMVLLAFLMRIYKEQAKLFNLSRVGLFDKTIRIVFFSLFAFLVIGPQRFKAPIGIALILFVLISTGLQHARLIADGLQPGFVKRISALFLLGSLSFTTIVVAMVVRR